MLDEYYQPRTSQGTTSGTSGQQPGKKYEWRFVMPKKYPSLGIIQTYEPVPEGWHILDPGVFERKLCAELINQVYVHFV